MRIHVQAIFPLSGLLPFLNLRLLFLCYFVFFRFFSHCCEKKRKHRFIYYLHPTHVFLFPLFASVAIRTVQSIWPKVSCHLTWEISVLKPDMLALHIFSSSFSSQPTSANSSQLLPWLRPSTLAKNEFLTLLSPSNTHTDRHKLSFSLGVFFPLFLFLQCVTKVKKITASKKKAGHYPVSFLFLLKADNIRFCQMGRESSHWPNDSCFLILGTCVSYKLTLAKN